MKPALGCRMCAADWSAALQSYLGGGLCRSQESDEAVRLYHWYNDCSQGSFWVHNHVHDQSFVARLTSGLAAIQII